MNEIVREYGAGLFLLCAEEDCAAEVLSEIREIKKLLMRSYLHLLITPSLPKNERVECVKSAFSGVHRYILNFMCLMTERGLADELPACFDEYEKLYYERYSVVRVKCESAYPLDDRQKTSLYEKLKKNIGCEVEIEYIVDKSLIGGMRLDYGNRLIEGSIKAHLSQIKEKLADTVL